MDEEFDLELSSEEIENFDWSNVDWDIPLRGIPSEIQTDSIRAWAESEINIKAVYIYGSRLFQTHREQSDLDIAVMLDVAHEYAYPDFLLSRKAWSAQLNKLTKHKVHLQLAHPAASPEVWSYLLRGAGLAYQK
ncbi:nucleotidyltransferase domain-containing protein [Thalassospira tepidiphila]|uniref:nucleotidyltransferase domain-containing protein n=1 Tax=Thalassospira tepidiphila TaxID=393657 RepID=UPI0030C6A651